MPNKTQSITLAVSPKALRLIRRHGAALGATTDDDCAARLVAYAIDQRGKRAAGGASTAERLTPAQRSASAKRAVAAREAKRSQLTVTLGPPGSIDAQRINPGWIVVATVTTWRGTGALIHYPRTGAYRQLIGGSARDLPEGAVRSALEEAMRNASIHTL